MEGRMEIVQYLCYFAFIRKKYIKNLQRFAFVVLLRCCELPLPSHAEARTFQDPASNAGDRSHTSICTTLLQLLAENQSLLVLDL